AHSPRSRSAPRRAAHASRPASGSQSVPRRSRRAGSCSSRRSMAAVEAAARRAWRGALALELEATPLGTAVTRRRHEGPFCIQRPFYPGDGACHVYLLHPPGGLAGGDELVLDARVGAGAAALLTTPAATKFYRSDGEPSAQRQTLDV